MCDVKYGRLLNNEFIGAYLVRKHNLIYVKAKAEERAKVKAACNDTDETVESRPKLEGKATQITETGLGPS